jgi:hypothetical protein
MKSNRVSRAAPRAGPATVARKFGPAGPYRGRGLAWSDNKSSWAVLPENVREDSTDEPDVLSEAQSNSLRRAFGDDTLASGLPGIHRRRHSDRRAAILRGSGPVTRWTSGWAGVTRS